MRRHAKASTAGSTQRQAGGLSRATAVVAALFVAALAFSAAPASAALIVERPQLFTFDGTGTAAGTFSNLDALDIDQGSGTVYAIDSGKNVIDKFDAAGVAQNFSATGSSSLSPGFSPGAFTSFTGLAVDNYGPNPGRIYAFRGYANGPLKAFSSAGQSLWELSGLSGGICGLAVDDEGHPWLGDLDTLKAREFASSGNPPAEIGSVSVAPDELCRLDFDASGNVYTSRNRVNKFVDGVKTATIDPEGSNDVAVDQSSATGHIFSLHTGGFNEYDSAGTLVGSFGKNISSGNGIAYNKALDRIYVSDTGADLVRVFGPPEVLGTAPDVTINPVVSESFTTAEFSGTINAQGVANSYHFEYKVGTGGDWSGATSSPAASVAEDSNPHAVSFAVSGLSPSSTYQVRLVAENTSLSLKNISKVLEFKTGKFAALTINDPAEITAHTVKVSGSVDPKESDTTWRFQTSTSPACLSGAGFTNASSHVIAANTGVTPVEEELTGLIANQDYCVRIAAANNPGTAFSAIKQFTTDASLADIETRGAAPRTDTTARLNAFVNPENDATTYRFEYSEDASTWTALPDHGLAASTTTTLVTEELTGLVPGTDYHFRVVAENVAGSASEEQPFSTRTSAEMTPSQRGIELVNNPDKGDQNAFAYGPLSETSPIAPDGDRALWTVFAGAPGSNSGTFGAFLAERTPEGWRSKSLVPTAEKQVGGGELPYRLEATTEDLSHFISVTSQHDVFNNPPQTVVRLDQDANQEILTTFATVGTGESSGLAGDLTTDGTHVVAINPETERLEDFGSGTPELVSVMPDGTPSSCPMTAFMVLPPALGYAGYNWRPGYHRIAQEDASRVYFQVSPNGDCAAPEGLYVRNRDTEQTTLIDPGAGGRSPEVIRSTPDGRHAYFLSPTQLDPADANSGMDVYRWDEGAGASTCITCEVAADANVERGEEGVLVSDDFSHVYFSSPNQLVPGRGKQGDHNVYSVNGGVLSFVASTATIDGHSILSDPGRSLLSADGQVLMFRAPASRSLTVDEVASKCLRLGTLDPGEVEDCQELYRYDDRDNSIECLSCAHGGLTTHTLGTPAAVTASVDFRISADGSTVPFATGERLVRRDVNNDTDIYEWRNGSLRLITDGVSDFQNGYAAPEVVGVDDSGDNILFSVVQSGLTGFEHDGLANIYDARIGGGFEPPAPPVHCIEDSCQGPLKAPPAQPQPGSASFSGRGNIPGAAQRSSRCAKGKVRRKGRCVRRHAHKRHHQRASHANQGRTK